MITRFLPQSEMLHAERSSPFRCALASQANKEHRQLISSLKVRAATTSSLMRVITAYAPLASQALVGDSKLRAIVKDLQERVRMDPRRADRPSIWDVRADVSTAPADPGQPAKANDVRVSSAKVGFSHKKIAERLRQDAEFMASGLLPEIETILTDYRVRARAL
eukprot:862097-Prymnesium_polylepis.1